MDPLQEIESAGKPDSSAVYATRIEFLRTTAFVTRRRPLLRRLHLGSLVWGLLVEILPWTCTLTPAENWLRTRAGIGSYQGGFLLHYLDSLVYPDVPPTLLMVVASAVCLFNLGVYAVRFRRRRVAGW